MNPKLTHSVWMSLAHKFAEASTCRINVGCVLVHNNELVGTGYVGSISHDVHCNEEGCLLVDNHGVRGSSKSGKSCIRTVHAEMNAVLRCKTRGQFGNWISAYCTHQPCLECTKVLLAIGVRHIYYTSDYADMHRDAYIAALRESIAVPLTIEKYTIGE